MGGLGAQLKNAVGFENTRIVNIPEVSLMLQVLESVAIKRTLYVPGLLYKWVGLTSVDVEPSPKSHKKLVPAKDVFSNTASYGAQPVPGVLNCARTSGFNLICLVMVSGALQKLVSITYSVTKYVPAEA